MSIEQIPLAAGGFVTSVLGLGVIEQINPETAIDQMAKGSAQLILSVTTVALACALVYLFRLWRKDVMDERAESKANTERMIKAIEYCHHKSGMGDQ